MIFERIDDQAHPCLGVCREANLIGLGIKESGHFRSYLLALREPIIPMHVAIVHHLLVITRGSLRGWPCKWPGGGGVEIDGVFCDRKLFADIEPVDHAKSRYLKSRAIGTRVLRQPTLSCCESYNVSTLSV